MGTNPSEQGFEVWMPMDFAAQEDQLDREPEGCVMTTMMVQPGSLAGGHKKIRAMETHQHLNSVRRPVPLYFSDGDGNPWCPSSSPRLQRLSAVEASAEDCLYSLNQ